MVLAPQVMADGAPVQSIRRRNVFYLPYGNEAEMKGR